MSKYTRPLEKDDEQDGGSARYRLPFALCKERGIQLPDWATPRDAWNALKGFNINPNAEYDKLRKRQKKDLQREYSKRKREEAREKSRQSKDPEHSPNYEYNPRYGFIAGVKQGDPMSFDKADGGNPNPYYKEDVEFAGELFGYTTNCQTCVVAFEARMRGFDVRALPNNRNPYIKDLSRMTNLAYVDKNGNHPAYIIPKSGEHKEKFIERIVKEGRYTVQFVQGGCGHIISAFRQDGKLVLYDPQNGVVVKNNKNYLQRKRNFRIMRVDNVEFDQEYVNYILKGTKNGH